MDLEVSVPVSSVIWGAPQVLLSAENTVETNADDENTVVRYSYKLVPARK